ncbi:unnamed protein product [Microthlaspi erraticum]|uniref:Uncharacterized protein n=1 Tax=Microthlaspi erraticum TaxID=1685480 RepID=A0A6D2KJA0_9BRAS|nr:unnamed protein product [Microthlaspi erraticum]
MAKKKKKKGLSQPHLAVSSKLSLAAASAKTARVNKKTSIPSSGASSSGNAKFPSEIEATIQVTPPAQSVEVESNLQASESTGQISPPDLRKSNTNISSPISDSISVEKPETLSPRPSNSEPLKQDLPATSPCRKSDSGSPRKWSNLFSQPAHLEEIGTPTQHISGAPFVLIPDENLESAKEEFKDFLFARFHGDCPPMGRIIRVLNAIWARSGPRIFVHNIGPGTYLLRVPNPRTKELLLSRNAWNIAGLPMFVAPWSPEFTPDDLSLSSTVVPVELRNVPYLLFNNESLSRIATAVVDLTKTLQDTVITGFTNGREVEVQVLYPWLPLKCGLCGKYGHSSPSCKRSPVNQRKRSASPVKKQKELGPERTGREYKKRSRSRRNNSKHSAKEDSPAMEENEILATSKDGEVSEKLIEKDPTMEEKPLETVDSIEKKPDDDKAQSPVNPEEDRLSEAKNQDVEPQTGSHHLSQVAESEELEKYFGNFAHHATARIVVVWDPSISVFVYKTSAQTVTCGIYLPAEKVSLTVTFVYAFNLLEERRALWDELIELNNSTPVASHPWAVIGDFNQILRVNHHSNSGIEEVEISGIQEFTEAMQNADLFEAQQKGPSFTWWNNLEDNPVAKKIDHAIINQSWSVSFPDAYADFLEPQQSDHAPCLFRVPSLVRKQCKPFKFFHHIIDLPNYQETIRNAWHSEEIVGTSQFRLVRSLKLLKPVLRQLNKRNFSGISIRVKEQAERISELQRTLLTNPSQAIVREEHEARAKWNLLVKEEEKFYRQKSRVRWLNLGDRNTKFFHRTVTQRASRNHIHVLKNSMDQLLTTP